MYRLFSAFIQYFCSSSSCDPWTQRPLVSHARRIVCFQSDWFLCRRVEVMHRFPTPFMDIVRPLSWQSPSSRCSIHDANTTIVISLASDILQIWPKRFSFLYMITCYMFLLVATCSRLLLTGLLRRGMPEYDIHVRCGMHNRSEVMYTIKSISTNVSVSLYI